ncbi:MAG TPA: glycosyltransferase family 4 protein [Gemmatimonadales bacterium]|nr:glycosyltransferase family 4 protein [Gemmatimonadales bacterium]
MRVLQVIQQPGGTGASLSALHLSLGLAERGVKVRFACPVDSELEEDARAAGLEVDGLPFVRRSRQQNAALLHELLVRHPVDVANSHSARDRKALTWLGLTRRLTVPVVVTRRQMPRSFYLENWLSGRVASRVIAVSPAVAEALGRRGTPREKIAVVANGLITARVDRPLSTAEVEAWRHRIEWDPNRRTILIAARRKAQDVVLRALQSVTTPVRLVMAGAGENAFSHLIAKVPDRHAVMSFNFERDIRPLYELAELVLLPTWDEGLSQALLEALALGCPVIASAVPGNAYVLKDGVNGRLLPLDAPDQWAKAIDKLLGDQALRERLGAAGRRTAREDFSLDRTVSGTIAVYRDVLGPPVR